MCLALAFAGSDIWLGYSTPYDAFAPRSSGRGKPRNHPLTSQSDPDFNSVGYFTGVDSRGWVWRGARDGDRCR